MALSIGFYRAEGWSRLALTRQPLEVVDQSDGSTPRSTMGSIAVLGIPYVPGGAIASYGQGDGGGGGGGGTHV